MNKYKEALERIRNYSSDETLIILKNEFDILEELVEKATPKSPNFNRGIEIQSWNGDCCSIGYTHDYWSCPNCNNPVNEYQKGCSQCLQALDWSEEEYDLD